MVGINDFGVEPPRMQRRPTGAWDDPDFRAASPIPRPYRAGVGEDIPGATNCVRRRSVWSSNGSPE